MQGLDWSLDLNDEKEVVAWKAYPGIGSSKSKGSEAGTNSVCFVLSKADEL